MGECSGQLLLERQEEAGRQRKRGDPQAGDRLRNILASVATDEIDLSSILSSVMNDVSSTTMSGARNST